MGQLFVRVLSVQGERQFNFDLLTISEQAFAASQVSGGDPERFLAEAIVATIGRTVPLGAREFQQVRDIAGKMMVQAGSDHHLTLNPGGVASQTYGLDDKRTNNGAVGRLTTGESNYRQLESNLEEFRLQLTLEQERNRHLVQQLNTAKSEVTQAERARNSALSRVARLENDLNHARTELNTVRTMYQASERENVLMQTKKALWEDELAKRKAAELRVEELQAQVAALQQAQPQAQAPAPSPRSRDRPGQAAQASQPSQPHTGSQDHPQGVVLDFNELLDDIDNTLTRCGRLVEGWRAVPRNGRDEPELTNLLQQAVKLEEECQGLLTEINQVSGRGQAALPQLGNSGQQWRQRLEALRTRLNVAQSQFDRYAREHRDWGPGTPPGPPDPRTPPPDSPAPGHPPTTEPDRRESLRDRIRDAVKGR